jgi:hypothetical protein
MRIGIHYDTGFFPGGRSSRTSFDAEQVALDMKAIAGDLNCAAVRIVGGDLDRLTVAAGLAAAEGLEVWFSPMPCELDSDEMLAVFDDSAARAEALRRQSAGKVVLVLGCEVSLFGRGVLPGADAYARIARLSAPGPELFAEYPAIVRRLNAFLSRAAETARAKFAGPLTYASGPWEQIDWTAFDIVGVDAYRDRGNASTFDRQLDELFVHGKPVAVTEFGCCTYRGAAERGGNGWAIVTGHGENQRLDGDYVRDESEQVAYLRELLEIYQRHGVDIAFWFTFASWNRPHRRHPREDMDLASFGVVSLAAVSFSPSAHVGHLELRPAPIPPQFRPRGAKGSRPTP